MWLFSSDSWSTVPLCCLDIVGFKNEVERLFVVELELQRLWRFSPQFKAKQRLTLQGRNVLRWRSNTDVFNIGLGLKGSHAASHVQKHERRAVAVRSHLTGSVRVQDFVFDDKPLPLPLLLVALGLVQVAAHGRIRVSRHLRDE